MSGSETAPAAITLLKWRIRDRDKKPEAMKFIVAAMAVAAVLGAWLLGPLWMFLGPAIVVTSLADFLFGRQFELTDRDARSRVFFSLSVMNWADVRRVIETETSVLLSPLDQTGWRDSFRGIQLDLAPDIKDQAWRIVREHVPADATYSVE